MRKSFAALVVAVVIPGSVAFGQNAQRLPPAAAKSTESFDPHDLSGIWEKSRGTLLTMSNEVPSFTPAGQAKFNATKPGYGPRQVPPAIGNDPMGTCDPLGMPRSLFLEVSINKMQIAQLPNRVFQFFEWQHSWREIWTDGRENPKDPDPRWMGYSVGKWDGNTFVVNSVGFDPRTWLDHFGNPVSDEMRMEERYQRADHDTLELTITLNDPKMYTKPWVSQKRVMKLANQKGFDEVFCVPSEEQAFNKNVRDPAGGKSGGK
jgi:hypothetical protein